jgi:hypothetical protein
MGWFDFLKKTAPPTSEEKRPAHEPGKSRKPPQDHSVVPEGHELIIHCPTFEPSVIRTRGGMVLANFGAAGDDPDVELDAILRGIEAALDEDAAPALLAKSDRGQRLHELFAPTDQQVVPLRSPLIWIFLQDSVQSLGAEPRRLQAVLRCMYVLSRKEEAPIMQVAYLVEPPSPDTLPFVRLIRGLSLGVRQPHDQEGGPCVLIEVVRPEGVILCALAGEQYPGGSLADSYALDINEEKTRAEAAGHDSLLRRLQEQELAGLVERVGLPEGKAQILVRAPRLRKLILDHEADVGKGGMAVILSELLSRNNSLLFMSGTRGSMEVATYGAAGNALPMFSDLRSLQWAAMDLGRKPGSFEIAAIHARELVAMAGEREMSIAICVYRDRKTPLYAILPGPLVKAAAKAAKTPE